MSGGPDHVCLGSSIAGPTTAQSPGDIPVECCGPGVCKAPESSDSEFIKPFLDGEGIMLDSAPGTLSNFLLHYRDSFIAWIDPHVPKRVVDALFGLYNQSLEQLEVDLEVVKECLEERFSQEMKWVKMILSLKVKIAFEEQHSQQKAADHRAELDDLRREVDQLKEGYNAETSKTFSSLRKLREALECANRNFRSMEGHFNRASERADRAEGDLAEAQTRIKLLEEDLEAAKERDTHNEDLYTALLGRCVS